MFKNADCHWRRQCFKYHPEIGWWHVPNLVARVPLGGRFHLFRSNSVGMRANREYEKVSPPGTKRIVFLGDSYTAGDGVDNEQRFSDLIEQRYAHLEVLNFALNGSGTDQQILIYEHLASAFEADAYVFGICVENIARNMCTCRPSMAWNESQVYYRPKPYFHMRDGGLELHNVPVPKERRPQDEIGDWECFFPYLQEHPGDAYAIYRYPDRTHWQLMRRIFERFLAAVSNKPVFLVPLPMYDHYLEWAPPGYLERFLELEDPPNQRWVLDILPAFLGTPLPERDAFRFGSDPHYTTTAHRVVADALCENIAIRCPELLN